MSARAAPTNATSVSTAAAICSTRPRRFRMVCMVRTFRFERSSPCLRVSVVQLFCYNGNSRAPQRAQNERGGAAWAAEDSACRQGLSGRFCCQGSGWSGSLLEASVLEGFICLLWFDQGLGLSAEHFERCPADPSGRGKLKLLVHGRLSFCEKQAGLVALAQLPFGHRQEQLLIVEIVRTRLWEARIDVD